MRFVQLTPDLSKEWDALVYSSDDAWLYHLYDWLCLTEDIWGLESKSFLVEHDGRTVGIFPLQIRKNSKSLRSIYMGTGGAAISEKVSPVFRERIMKAMYEHAEEVAREIGSSDIEISLPPLAESSLRNRWGVNPLVNHFYQDTSTHTWLVDLRKNEENILANLTKDARRSMKNARDAGYNIRKLKDQDEVAEYYRVHRETYDRTGADPFPETYFRGIYEHMCQKGHAVVWTGTSRNGSPVAFEIIGLFKKGAIYWAGCCETEHLDSGVNYWLQYNSMICAKGSGAEWFENGEAFPNVRNGKLRGLTTFKGKFGGETHRFYRGRLVLTDGPSMENAFGDWLRCTALLLRPILGKRVIESAKGLLKRPFRTERDP